MLIRLYDIEWETDGEDVILPEEVIIDNPDDDMIEALNNSYDDEIANYLSDEYGWLVASFRWEELDVSKNYY